MTLAATALKRSQTIFLGFDLTHFSRLVSRRELGLTTNGQARSDSREKVRVLRTRCTAL